MKRRRTHHHSRCLSLVSAVLEKLHLQSNLLQLQVVLKVTRYFFVTSDIVMVNKCYRNSKTS